MTAKEILAELAPLGSDSYKRMLFNNYGVKEPCFGVKIGHLKKFQQRIKKDYQLALDLFDSGNYDAMYLAGLIADDQRMTKKDLNHWVRQAYGGALPGATVPWVAAGSPHGWELAQRWIDSPKERVAEAGWITLASLVALKDDSDLDLPALKRLVARAERTIHRAPNAVRYAMNAFVIAVGCYVKSLTEFALEAGQKIGQVKADLGNNQCTIPFITDSIRKVQKRGAIGKKRKTARC